MPEARKVRYAVVGLGWISQVAVLPAFRNANNCELSVLFSEDPEKRAELGKKYGVTRAYGYEQYDEVLHSGEVDAVYIALPNHMHLDYTRRAARAGVHVLCEKPMAITEAECEEMIRAAEDARVKLMLAYRLHFDPMNMEAVEAAKSGVLGQPRYFVSAFSQQVPEGNIRLRRATGGGTLYDIGIYCINAARYLFREEPTEVLAVTANNGEQRFREIEEATTAVLRFPGEALATFTCSFGAASVSSYRLAGTEGDLLASPAYTFNEEMNLTITTGGKKQERKFPATDQFGPELIYFADCIVNNKDPEPDGFEGLADVRVITALYRSAESGAPVKLPPFERRRRPGREQEMKEPPVQEPRLVHAQDPSQAA